MKTRHSGYAWWVAVVLGGFVAPAGWSGESLADLAVKEAARRAKAREGGVKSVVVDNEALARFSGVRLVELKGVREGAPHSSSAMPVPTPAPEGNLQGGERVSSSLEEEIRRLDYISGRLESNALVAHSTSITDEERDTLGQGNLEERRQNLEEQRHGLEEEKNASNVSIYGNGGGEH